MELYSVWFKMSQCPETFSYTKESRSFIYSEHFRVSGSMQETVICKTLTTDNLCGICSRISCWRQALRFSGKSEQLFLPLSGWPLRPQKGHRIAELYGTKCADGHRWSRSGRGPFKYCISIPAAEGIPKVKVKFIFIMPLSQALNGPYRPTAALVALALHWEHVLQKIEHNVRAWIKLPLQWHQPTKLGM